MLEILISIVLPTLTTGVLFLATVATFAWIGNRFFGYEPTGYRERFQSSTAPKECTLKSDLDGNDDIQAFLAKRRAG